MKVYCNLYIVLTPTNDRFLDLLVEQVDSSDAGWKVRQDLSDRLRSYDAESTSKVLCIESPVFNFEGNDIQGCLWLRQESNRIELSNIVPIISHHLTPDEYNFLLWKFVRVFLSDPALQTDAKIEVTDDTDKISNYIGDDGEKILLLFSEMANKSTGCSHPMDFNRWCDFIFVCHDFRERPGTDLLRDWLYGHGWSEKVAEELVLKYEYSLEMLDRYDQYKYRSSDD